MPDWITCTISGYEVDVDGLQEIVVFDVRADGPGTTRFRSVGRGRYEASALMQRMLHKNQQGFQSLSLHKTNFIDVRSFAEFKVVYRTNAGDEKEALARYSTSVPPPCGAPDTGENRDVVFNLEEGTIRLLLSPYANDKFHPLVAQYQVKIPRILRKGSSKGVVSIEALADGKRVDLKKYNSLPGSSIRYVNFDNGGFFSLGQNTKDLRLSFVQDAKLVFSEDSTGVQLGEISFGPEPESTLPGFKTLTSAGHAFEVEYWQARCGAPFPFGYGAAVIGVRVEREGADQLWDSFGETRDWSQLQTVGWFVDPQTQRSLTYKFFYGQPSDDPPNTVAGIETGRGQSYNTRIGYEPGGQPMRDRRYSVDAWKGPSLARLYLPSADGDPQDFLAIVGTSLSIMDIRSTKLLGSKTTGQTTPFKVFLLDGYIHLDHASADGSITWTEKSSGKGYAYLSVYCVDRPFGKAEDR